MNIDPRLYFGVVLDPAEACRFVIGEVVPHLPGRRQMLEMHRAAPEATAGSTGVPVRDNER